MNKGVKVYKQPLSACGIILDLARKSLIRMGTDSPSGKSNKQGCRLKSQGKG
jgi:hypothetical protein